MDRVTVAVVFLLGAAAALIILRVLFQVANRPFRSEIDEHYLQRIANALQ